MNRCNSVLCLLSCLIFSLPPAVCLAQAPAAAQPSVELQGTTLPLYKNSYALVIGIAHYGDPAWRKLANALQDAKEVAAALGRQGFAITLVPDPTGEGLKQAMTDFFAQYGRDPDNRLVVYYSGHGHTIGNTGYLVPADAPDPVASEAGFLKKALPMSRIAAEATDYRARHILYVFDSCFSGAIFSTRNSPAAVSLDQADLALYFSGPAAAPVRYFITAGTAEQKVPDISQFTPAFISALEGSVEEINRNGYISARDIGTWLRRKLSAYPNWNQTPMNSPLLDSRFDQGDMAFQVRNWRTRPAPAAPPAATPAPAATPSATAAVALPPASTMPPVATAVKAPVPVPAPADCAVCPKTVRLPGGPLIIGTARAASTARSFEASADIHLHSFEIATTKVTVGQYRRFVRATGHASTGCSRKRTWERPGFEQGDDHPVVCVGHQDALAYAAWVSRQAGADGRYRLPSSAEWEYAAKGRDRSIADNIRPYPKNVICEYENVLDKTGLQSYWGIGFPCKDGYEDTSPVAAFKPNTWGLYDISGNVVELLADCAAPNSLLPKDGEPYAGKKCGSYLVAGASYDTDTYDARTAARYVLPLGEARKNIGFRLVRQ